MPDMDCGLCVVATCDKTVPYRSRVGVCVCVCVVVYMMDDQLELGGSELSE